MRPAPRPAPPRPPLAPPPPPDGDAAAAGAPASPLAALAGTALLAAASDAAFATGLAVLAYRAPAARVWQGVAGVALGPRAPGGGAGVLAGLAVHVGVAAAWSAVLFAAARRSPPLRAALRTRAGLAAVAVGYGALVWLVMSGVVVPLRLHRPPAVTARWWVQLLGHGPFVGLPIAWGVARALRRGRRR